MKKLPRWYWFLFTFKFCRLTQSMPKKLNLRLFKVRQVISAFGLKSWLHGIHQRGHGLFEHVKTGAKMFFIRSKDIERSFEIAFRTPAVDDTGVNHILEHISISGSKNTL